MSESKRKFVLISGATGRLGYHVVREFVHQGYEVRILCRSIPKAKSLFFDIFDQIELFEIDFLFDVVHSNLEKFTKAFEKSQKQTPLTHVVSIAGSVGYVDRTKTEILDFKCHKHLIDAAKAVPSIEKFIFISTMAITRPWSLISLLLNIYVKNVMSWKLETENYLRSSGLNHVIIRPGGLLKEKESKATAVTLVQGDKDMGMIERSSVAKVLVSVCDDENFKPKVTFEVYSKKEQMAQPFYWNPPNFIEDEGKVIANRNFRVRKLVVSGFWCFVVCVLALSFQGQIVETFKKLNRNLLGKN